MFNLWFEDGPRLGWSEAQNCTILPLAEAGYWSHTLGAYGVSGVWQVVVRNFQPLPSSHV